VARPDREAGPVVRATGNAAERLGAAGAGWRWRRSPHMRQCRIQVRLARDIAFRMLVRVETYMG
jgi:hypothetical protein